MRLRVLRNTTNQGYGGNQKIGYAYAIEHGFDIVALVHGTGSTRPRSCRGCWSRCASGEAEAVFGSRMMVKGGALRGGMPLYKFVGNKILTAVQNTLLRSRSRSSTPATGSTRCGPSPGCTSC